MAANRKPAKSQALIEGPGGIKRETGILLRLPLQAIRNNGDSFDIRDADGEVHSMPVSPGEFLELPELETDRQGVSIPADGHWYRIGKDSRPGHRPGQAPSDQSEGS